VSSSVIQVGDGAQRGEVALGWAVVAVQPLVSTSLLRCEALGQGSSACRSM